MFNINLKRFLIYNSRKLFTKKPNYVNDSSFEFVNSLRKNGFYKKKEFSKKNILANEIITQFEKIPNIELQNICKANKNNFERYGYRSKITNLFDKKLLYEYANQRIFIENFEQYFGLKPKVRLISVWIDYPTDNKERDSQIFHRDYDDVFLTKTFLCLTDINYDNGPFQFIPKSHIAPWDKKLDTLHNKPTFMTAEKGDLYMADTNGFHRGTKLKKNFRCLVNVHYVSNSPMTGFPDQIIN